MPVIFFDIGDTLASPRLSADASLIGFTVFPEARAALETLSARSLRMGIISNRGNIPAETVTRSLEASGILGFFDPRIVIFERKDSPAPFVRAAATASVPPSECIFVGEDSAERGHALNAGFSRVVPHPRLVPDVVDGANLVFALVSLQSDAATDGAWQQVFRHCPLVPLRVSGGARRSFHVITTRGAVERLGGEGYGVTILGRDDDPQVTDLYLIRDDRPAPAGLVSAEEFSADFLAAEGRRDLVVGSTAGGLLVALPAGVSVEDLHFPEALHGHNERLAPNMSLLASLRRDTTSTLAAAAALAPALGEEELEAVRGITPERMRRLHERYIGALPLDNSDARVASRHIRHADNARAVEALASHFSEVGGDEIIVRRHPFKHQGLSLQNLEAELPGEVPDSFVLITAHLDSTASASGGGFNPVNDPAPGSDDDASGVAAVMAAAQAVAELRRFKRTRHTLRFVLFNAEEQGLVGSKSYANVQRAAGADIAAVFQMDMIGFRGQETSPSRDFEIHAGFAAAPDVEARSIALARLVLDAVAPVSPNMNAPQVYPDAPGGFDPASGRSDHAAFHERGYAACVTTEDFFAGPRPDSPEARPNPNYHRDTDREIDYEYAADIARVVTAAALTAANM